MTDPKQPIPLDYKTPEKGERVTAWMVIERTIVGSLGILATVAALALSWTTVLVFSRGIYSNDRERIVIGLISACLVFVIWNRAFSWLRYSITGRHKSPNLIINPYI